MSQSQPTKPDSQSSVIARTYSCQTCNSLLLTRGVVPGQQIRCGRCGDISRFGTVESVPTDRLAWRSFWLGLSSIVLLFITGLPAIYYGIKSLMRMRFSKPKTSDRVAAIVGTSMGGCFGIVVGAMVLLVGGAFLFALATKYGSEDPAEIRQLLAESCELQVPEDAQPVAYQTVFMNSQRNFRFANSTERNQQSLYISLHTASSSMQVHRTQLLAIISGARKPSGKPFNSKKLKWTVNNEVCDVQKNTYRIKPNLGSTDDENDDLDEDAFELVDHYYGIIPSETECFGLILSVNTTRRPMTESEVEAIWTSLRPVQK